VAAYPHTLAVQLGADSGGEACPPGAGDAGRRFQTAVVTSATRASRLAKMNSFSAAGFRSIEARSGPFRSTRPGHNGRATGHRSPGHCVLGRRTKRPAVSAPLRRCRWSVPQCKSGGDQQGYAGLLVGGLDERDRVDADAFVGAVQALVFDAESCGCLDAETCQVVPDVRWPGDLCCGR
jgi:hypothetical protein